MSQLVFTRQEFSKIEAVCAILYPTKWATGREPISEMIKYCGEQAIVCNILAAIQKSIVDDSQGFYLVSIDEQRPLDNEKFIGVCTNKTYGGDASIYWFSGGECYRSDSSDSYGMRGICKEAWPNYWMRLPSKADIPEGVTNDSTN